MKVSKIEVRGDSGKTYTIRADAAGVVSCTCPSWKFQHAPIAARSCKHIAFVKGAVA